MKIPFKINLFTYIFFLILVFSGYINYLVIFLGVIIFHELGHILTIKLLGYKINKIDIYPCGGVIDTDILLNIPSLHLFLISISGIVFQTFLFFIPDSGSYNYDIFFTLNKSLILFNLLPIFPLDGYKILMSIYENIFSYRVSLMISNILSYISLFFMFIYTKSVFIFIFLYIFNINYYLNYKYYINKFLLERYLYKVKYQKEKIVDNIKSFYKSRKNIIKYDKILIEEDVILNKLFNTYY